MTKFELKNLQNMPGRRPFGFQNKVKCFNPKVNKFHIRKEKKDTWIKYR